MRSTVTGEGGQSAHPCVGDTLARH
jgi:hypothetical protein